MTKSMCISFSFLFRPENQFLTEVGSVRVVVPPPPPDNGKTEGEYAVKRRQTNRPN